MREITLENISLSDIDLPNDLPLLYELRQKTVSAKPEVCVERARYVTRYLSELSSDDEPRETRYAKAVNHFLSNRSPVFPDGNLLAGTTTSKLFGTPVFPEFVPALTVWPELGTMSTRERNPILITSEEAEELNAEIFPYWMDRNILEYTRKKYDEPECLELFQRLVYFIAGKAGCLSHTVPDFRVALERGLDQIIDKARDNENELSALSGRSAEQEHSLLFYRAVQISMKGILRYAANLSREAERLAGMEADAGRRDNLLRMSEVCARVPAGPARTFREAVNGVWLLYVAILAEDINMAISPGRLDQLLYPYYRKDIDDGRLTVREALELVGCLWIKLNDNTNLVPETSDRLFGGAGTVPAVTLGGVDDQGGDAVNDLTYIMLRVTEMLRLRNPNVNARYHCLVNTEAYRNRLTEVIARTRAVPAIHNDITDIDTLVNQGVRLEHARDYAIIGCVELTSAGREYGASSSIILNLVSALELALNDGKRPGCEDERIGPGTGDPAGFDTFEDFWKALRTQLEWLIDNAVELNEMFGRVHQELQPSPLLSAFFQGPMEKGRDLVFGGALYNSSGATHVGFADTVDSLNAIEQAVFIDGHCSFDELKSALRDDFAGHDHLHAYLVNKTSNFGSEDEISTKNAGRLVKLLYDHYQSKVNYRGGRYRPAYWTMTNHAGMGQICGAQPNGRRAGKPFSSGITPVSQQADDLTRCLNAVAKLDHLCMPGGLALNIKYPGLEGDDALTFAQLVEGYFRAGGMQVQFNIMSYRMLLEAMKNDCADLLVRVSGYSAYFRDLNRAMKEEIIARTEYDLKTCRMNAFPGEHRSMLPLEGA